MGPVAQKPANARRAKVDRRQEILAAAIAIIGRDGLAGLSMRSVAREAGVSLGLVNYYFEEKTNLVAAVLKRVEADDLALLASDPGLEPTERLATALDRIMDRDFLTTDYLALRLQLWATAQADDDFARINATAQRRYRKHLAELIANAVPGIDRAEASRRAADIDIIQNGIWLTALLKIDRASLNRAAQRCRDIAFARS